MRTKALLLFALVASVLSWVLVPAQAQAATAKPDKTIVVTHPAVTVKSAAPAGVSTTATYTYSTRTQRYDLYPPGCGGYIGVIFTWSLRSDGASLVTKLHTGTNMSCGSALSNSYLRWGTGCPPPIWKWGPTENFWTYNGGAHDYTYPFGTAYANSAGHPTAVAPFDFTNGQKMSISDSAHWC